MFVQQENDKDATSGGEDTVSLLNKMLEIHNERDQKLCTNQAYIKHIEKESEKLENEIKRLELETNKYKEEEIELQTLNQRTIDHIEKCKYSLAIGTQSHRNLKELKEKLTGELDNTVVQCKNYLTEANEKYEESRKMYENNSLYQQLKNLKREEKFYRVQLLQLTASIQQENMFIEMKNEIQKKIFYTTICNFAKTCLDYEESKKLFNLVQEQKVLQKNLLDKYQELQLSNVQREIDRQKAAIENSTIHFKKLQLPRFDHLHSSNEQIDNPKDNHKQKNIMQQKFSKSKSVINRETGIPKGVLKFSKNPSNKIFDIVVQNTPKNSDVNATSTVLLNSEKQLPAASVEQIALEKHKSFENDVDTVNTCEQTTDGSYVLKEELLLEKNSEFSDVLKKSVKEQKKVFRLNTLNIFNDKMEQLLKKTFTTSKRSDAEKILSYDNSHIISETISIKKQGNNDEKHMEKRIENNFKKLPIEQNVNIEKISQKRKCTTEEGDITSQQKCSLLQEKPLVVETKTDTAENTGASQMLCDLTLNNTLQKSKKQKLFDLNKEMENMSDKNNISSIETVETEPTSSNEKNNSESLTSNKFYSNQNFGMETIFDKKYLFSTYGTDNKPQNTPTNNFENKLKFKSFTPDTFKIKDRNSSEKSFGIPKEIFLEKRNCQPFSVNVDNIKKNSNKASVGESQCFQTIFNVNNKLMENQISPEKQSQKDESRNVTFNLSNNITSISTEFVDDKFDFTKSEMVDSYVLPFSELEQDSYDMTNFSPPANFTLSPAFSSDQSETNNLKINDEKVTENNTFATIFNFNQPIRKLFK